MIAVAVPPAGIAGRQDKRRNLSRDRDSRRDRRDFSERKRSRNPESKREKKRNREQCKSPTVHLFHP